MVVSYYGGMPGDRQACWEVIPRHAWRRRDSVDRRSYLMFIMLMMCQPLFKIDDKVVACVASAGNLMIAGAVQFQRRSRDASKSSGCHTGDCQSATVAI